MAVLIWIDVRDGLACENGILPADAVQKILDAQEARSALGAQADSVLQRAQEQADQILAGAQEQARQLLDQAEQAAAEAERKGHEEGIRRAVMEWHERQAGEAIQKADALRAMHEKLAEVVTTAVERMVTTEPRAALYQRALKNVQTLTRGASSLTLRVNPCDHDQARQSLDTLENNDVLAVEVAVDPSLRPGSCIFESELGVLDASLETQLDGLRAAMSRAVVRAIGQEGAAAVGETIPAQAIGNGATHAWDDAEHMHDDLHHDHGDDDFDHEEDDLDHEEDEYDSEENEYGDEGHDEWDEDGQFDEAHEAGAEDHG